MPENWRYLADVPDLVADCSMQSAKPLLPQPSKTPTNRRISSPMQTFEKPQQVYVVGRQMDEYKDRDDDDNGNQLFFHGGFQIM